jgi:hypothetical protein
MAQSSRASEMRWRKPASDRFAVFQAVRLSMLRTFCGTEDTSSKSNSMKEKKLSRQLQRRGYRWRRQTWLSQLRSQGDRTLALSRVRLQTRPSVTLPFKG